MALDFTTGNAALKELYLGPTREQLNSKVFLLSQIEKNSKDVVGSEAVLNLHVSRNSGIGSRAENTDLPTAGNQGYVNSRITLKAHYGRITVTGKVMRAMKSDQGSFIRAVESEIKGAVTDLRSDINRQLFGTSDGVIAATTDGASSTTVTFAVGTLASQKRQITVGMKVDIGDGTPFTSLATNRTVESVAANTFVISGAAIDTTANSRIVRAGNGGSGAAQVELTGLQTIVDSAGALWSVDPATYPSWSATETAVNGAISESIVETAIHDVDIAGGAAVNLIVTSHGVQRAYSNLLTTLKRFPSTLDLKGGYKGLSITAGESGELAIKTDKDCPNGTAFGLTTSEIQEYQASDWEWMDEDGSVLNRVPNRDAYEAVLFKENEVATTQRNAHFKLTGITEA